MRYHHAMTYDAPAPVVFAMLTDPEFQEQRALAGNPLHAEASVEPGPGDGATVTVSRRMAIDPPGFIKKFTGDELTITEIQQWRDSAGSLVVRDGVLIVEVADQPADVQGVLRIDEAGEATTVTADAEIKVRVPLVGGKVESYIAGMLDKLLNHEEELGRAWLSER